MAHMFSDDKSFAKHIQESGVKAEEMVKEILKKEKVNFYRPGGRNIRIDYIF